jgi:uncharacterized protein YxjI
MRYLMKQRIWSMGDDYRIKDQAGRDCFYVDGKAFSFGDKLSFLDMAGSEVAFIDQKLMAWGPTYEIYRGGRLFAVVKEKIWTFLKNRFTVDVGADGPGPGDLEVEGDFLDHEYQFLRDGRVAAQVSKKWFSWSDTYGVDVADGEDDVLILACTVVVDLCSHPDKRR